MSGFNLMNGKAGLVTGAGKGIGRACAIAFAREGAKVVVACRTEADGLETVRMIQENGGTAVFCKCDVSVEADVEALVATTLREFGRVDFAVNNAGMCIPVAKLADTSSADFDRIMKVNLYGEYYCLKHEIKAMLPQGGGAIVNVSSGKAMMSGPNEAAYAASKHAVNGMTRSVAVEYAGDGIRINALCPGATDTPILSWLDNDPALKEVILNSIPTGRLAQPEEIAHMAVFLCSDLAACCVGSAFLVDCGSWAKGG